MSRRRKPTAIEFEHPLKPPLERWLLLNARLREVETALEHVIGYMGSVRQSKKVTEDPIEGHELVRPLLCFAIVTYVRCFGGGRRPPLRLTDVPRLTERDRQIHGTVRELRNQHFAHAVSDDEGAHIIAVPPQSGHDGGFSAFSIVLLSMNKPELRAFLRLVRKVRRFVEGMESRDGDRLSRALFGATATWAACLENGSRISKEDV